MIIPTDERRTTFLLSILNYGGTTVGRKNFEELMGNKIDFSYPKPVVLLKKIIETATDQNSIILDFFSGSSTTADAVMRLNFEDGGRRRFIMVQLPEPTSEKSDAFKSGFKNICEIGKERIRRAGERIRQESESDTKNQSGTANLENLEKPTKSLPDIGFKVFKLDTSNLRKWNCHRSTIASDLQDSLLSYELGRTDFDLLYEIMLKFGIDLASDIDEIDIKGKTLYVIADGGLSMFVCFDESIDMDVIYKIIEIKDLRGYSEPVVAFRDNGFLHVSDKACIRAMLAQSGVKTFITV